MTRKGSRKVKTGCYTCKIRKIKCDDAKPFCRRCTGTGRKCDGYPAAAAETAPSLQTYRPGMLPAPRDRREPESRALQFFREVVGPVLSGPADTYFWNQLVPQFALYEPAVRHAAVAVSALYEQLHCGAGAGAGAGGGAAPRTRHVSFAVGHYNAAIREVVSAQNESLALLVCVLFICMEFMQGTHEAATQHCRHGIAIFNKAGAHYPWVMQHLFPILRRLSIFPLLAGTPTSALPSLSGGRATSIPSRFASLADAQHALDALVCPGMRLVRAGYERRVGPPPRAPVPDSLRAEQAELASLLEEWHATFLRSASALDAPHAEAPVGANGNAAVAAAKVRLQMNHLVAKIWASVALDLDETAYDRHMDDFQSMVDLASAVATTLQDHLANRPCERPRFVFEMGFMPLLYFVVFKCRRLDLRLVALRLMKSLASHKENMWNADELRCVGRRVIEVEHDIDLGSYSLDASHTQDCAIDTLRLDLPPDCKRLRDASIVAGDEFRPDKDGNLARGRRVNLLVLLPTGALALRADWAPLLGSAL